MTTHSTRVIYHSPVATWGKMELTPDKRSLIFRLYDGSNYEERVDLRDANITHPFQRTKFSEQFQQFDLSTFQLTRTDEKLFKSNYEMLNTAQLKKSIDSIHKEDLEQQKNFSKYPSITIITCLPTQ